MIWITELSNFTYLYRCQFSPTTTEYIFTAAFRLLTCYNRTIQSYKLLFFANIYFPTSLEGPQWFRIKTLMTKNGLRCDKFKVFQYKWATANKNTITPITLHKGSKSVVILIFKLTALNWLKVTKQLCNNKNHDKT